MKMHDLTGQRFGRLVVLYLNKERNKLHKLVWHCKCDCGKECDVVSGSLVTGLTTSCGCSSIERISQLNRKYLTGCRFGILTVVRESGRKNNQVVWECRCDCGKIVYNSTSALMSGDVRSCGCLRRTRVETGFYVDDLSGRRFGRLLVLQLAPRNAKCEAAWLCRCDCGKELIVRAHALVSGNTRSCGCLRVDQAKERYTIYKTQEEQDIYSRFKGMKSRCYNKNNPEYHIYGGAGVYICDEWLNDPMNFVRWAQSHGYSKDLTIDRYPDRKGPYAPWNCRWVGSFEQNNNRCDTVFFTVRGQTHSRREWENILSLDKNTLKRIYDVHGKDAAETKIDELLLPDLIVPGSVVIDSVIPELEVVSAPGMSIA